MNKKIPHTPLSTHLSGSVKETEIRLKNIFSGPKKRPPVLFLALIFSICVLCGNLVAFQSQAVEMGRSAAPIAAKAGSGLMSILTDYFKALANVLQKSTNPSTGVPDWDDEFDKLEEKNDKEWEDAQIAEYRAAGVTMDGKNYYYQGQLVNIFLDIRPNKSFYTLDTNPEGTVNIKIVRNENNEITGVTYMTEPEVAELLDEWREEAEEEKEDRKAAAKSAWTGGQKEAVKAALRPAWFSEYEDDWNQRAAGAQGNRNISEIPVHLDTVADGEMIWLGEYALSEGDRIRFNVSAETGTGLQIGFAKPGDEDLNTTYYSVNNLRKNGGILKCTADMMFRPPAKPGTYKLFLRATDGALGNVAGNISIAVAES